MQVNISDRFTSFNVQYDNPWCEMVEWWKPDDSYEKACARVQAKRFQLVLTSLGASYDFVVKYQGQSERTMVWITGRVLASSTKEARPLIFERI